jgi:hypothetical protein
MYLHKSLLGLRNHLMLSIKLIIINLSSILAPVLEHSLITLEITSQVSHYSWEMATRIDSNSAEGVFLTPTGHTLQESSLVTFGITQGGLEQRCVLRDTSGQDAQDF